MCVKACNAVIIKFQIENLGTQNLNLLSVSEGKTSLTYRLHLAYSVHPLKNAFTGGCLESCYVGNKTDTSKVK